MTESTALTSSPGPSDPIDALVRARTADLLRSNESFCRDIDALRQQNHEILQQLAEAVTGRRMDREMRRAALNLMEDAIESRRDAQRESAERRRAEDDLRAADRRKDEFLAILSHELRNPLAPIRNTLHILKSTEQDRDAVRAAVDAMEDQVDHVVSLVNDLLDVSRISQGKIELRREVVDLADIVRKAVVAAQPFYETRELTVTTPNEPVCVNGDATRLVQVLGNLLHNAAKFTDRHGRVEVLVQRTGDHALIKVRDDGIGIAEDQQQRIFETFAQVDATLARSMGGLGLGLTLVKNLLVMHGGSIDVHSHGLGQGTEFVVRMPAVECDSNRAPAPPDPPAVSERSQGPAKILVVDDSRPAADSLAMLLKLEGYEAYARYDGIEAIAAAEALCPDVVILDIGMPAMNGYEACHAMRQQPWGRHMGIVALTGWGQDSDIERAKAAGFDTHIVKPAKASRLKEVLSTLLERPSTQSATD